jgi:hypothetical protein
MTSPRRPRRPRRLQAAGRALWDEITAEFELGPAEIQILTRACRCADVIESLEADLAGSDLILKRNGKPDRSSPVLVEMRLQTLVFARLLASLRLPGDDDGRAGPAPKDGGLFGFYTGRPAAKPAGNRLN